MTTYRIAVLAAAAALLAVPARPQTAGELLQKGIYTQDTAGDLDGAIAIYRQIVNSGNSPRDIAAQAQYRLAQSLIEKGVVFKFQLLNPGSTISVDPIEVDPHQPAFIQTIRDIGYRFEA